MAHAHQDIQGWPLGLRPLNPRVGGLIRRNLDFDLDLDLDLSASFNTLLTASPTNSSISSSDLDTQSTGSSFFHDKSKSLGSLIGVSSILQTSRRSIRTTTETIGLRDHRKMNQQQRPKPWLFSLCSNLTTDAIIPSRPNTHTPSLAHFLAAERRPLSTSTTATTNGTKPNTHFLRDGNIFGARLLFPTMCGQLFK